MVEKSVFQLSGEARLAAAEGERQIALAVAAYVSRQSSKFIEWLTRGPVSAK
jgi:hypothetical protein